MSMPDSHRPNLWLASIGLMLVVPASAAQNWPSFRGENASGVGRGSPPVEWSVASGQNVKWKVEIPGLGHSSPIVWGDHIFITTAVAEVSEPVLQTGWMRGSGDPAEEDYGWEWKVLCLNRNDGRLLWQQTACAGKPKAKRHPKSSHASCTPATDGKHVLAFFASEGLYCYDIDGQLLWKKDLGLLDAGPTKDYQWGFASSPIIHDGLAIVQCDAFSTAFWAAFDIRTGEEVRRVRRDDASTWCTPTVVTLGGRTQLVCNGYKHMGGYDLRTGAELWKLGGGGDVPVPTPIVANELIILTNGHGRSPVYAIRPDARGALTPEGDRLPPGLAWHNGKGGSYMPTPLAHGDFLYIANDNGILSVLEVRTGREIYKERLPQTGATYSASPVAADGRLYLTSEAGDVHVVQMGGAFKLLASNTMDEACMATPAITDGLLLVRGVRHLFCLAR